MRLRTSSFAHQIPTGANSVLLVHAISQLRLKVDAEVGKLVQFFTETREVPAAYAEISKIIPYDANTIAVSVKALLDRGFLTEKTAEEETAEIAAKLGPTYGRDPAELLDKYRREMKEGARDYWTAGTAQKLKDLGGEKPRLDLVLFGDCDVHMESDFLRRKAAERGYDLRVAP